MYPTEEETDCWIALNLAQRSVYRNMDAALRKKGLPPLRWYDVLWAIERAGTCGLRPFEMEEGLLFEQSNLSRMLRKAIERGLVAESVFEGDRRGKVLTITDIGRRVRKEMWAVYGPQIQVHMSRVSGKDRDKLIAALAVLREPPN